MDNIEPPAHGVTPEPNKKAAKQDDNEASKLDSSTRPGEKDAKMVTLKHRDKLEEFQQHMEDLNRE